MTSYSIFSCNLVVRGTIPGKKKCKILSIYIHLVYSGYLPFARSELDNMWKKL